MDTITVEHSFRGCVSSLVSFLVGGAKKSCSFSAGEVDDRRWVKHHFRGLLIFGGHSAHRGGKVATCCCSHSLPECCVRSTECRKCTRVFVIHVVALIHAHTSREMHRLAQQPHSVSHSLMLKRWGYAPPSLCS